MKSIALCLPLLLLSGAQLAAEEHEWGNLTGQIIYDGEPPPRAVLAVKPGFPLTLDERLIVHPETRGLANVFVYLRSAADKSKPLRVHPDFEAARLKPVRMFASEHGFRPHALCVVTGQELIFDHSQSKVAINQKLDLPNNGTSSVIVPPILERPRVFEKAESLPAQIGCNIHPWFSAHILVRDNPYMAVTDEAGRFEIKNLPAGVHEFQFWHEVTGYVDLPEFELRGGKVRGKLDKGRPLLEIRSGENDLGRIKLEPKQFHKY